MTPENKLGAFASYLEIEYQQKNNQCKLILEDVADKYKDLEIFKRGQCDDEQYHEAVKKYILKPILSAEDAYIYAEELNENYKTKFKKLADKCSNQEYVVSVEDVLSKYIVEFEYNLEHGQETIQSYKFEVYDFLGIHYSQDKTV